MFKRQQQRCQRRRLVAILDVGVVKDSTGGDEYRKVGSVLTPVSRPPKLIDVPASPRLRTTHGRSRAHQTYVSADRAVSSEAAYHRRTGFSFTLHDQGRTPTFENGSVH